MTWEQFEAAMIALTAGVIVRLVAYIVDRFLPEHEHSQHDEPNGST